MEVIVVSSGKGGVGKTTTSASLAAGFARRGQKVAVIDFDVGLRNLDLVMGCERRVVHDLVHVMRGEATLNSALVADRRLPNLYVLAAPQTCNKNDLEEEDLAPLFDWFEQQGFDKIICDSPAGLDKGSRLAMRHADRVIMVVNAEISSLRDADRMLGFFTNRPRRGVTGNPAMGVHVIVTRYRPHMVENGTMVSVDDIQELLVAPIIGVIPESGDVLAGSNAGEPVALRDDSRPGLAYRDAVARIDGERRPFRFVKPEPRKRSFLGWLPWKKTVTS